jgi:hypothetical protein
LAVSQLFGCYFEYMQYFVCLYRNDWYNNTCTLLVVFAIAPVRLIEIQCIFSFSLMLYDYAVFELLMQVKISFVFQHSIVLVCTEKKDNENFKNELKCQCAIENMITGDESCHSVSVKLIHILMFMKILIILFVLLKVNNACVCLLYRHSNVYMFVYLKTREN